MPQLALPYYTGNPYQYVRPPLQAHAYTLPATYPIANAPQTLLTNTFALVPQALLANTLLDTGASTHADGDTVTSQPVPPPSNLENVFVGNGQYFPFKAIYSMSLPSLINPQVQLHLNYTLMISFMSLL